MGKKVYYKIWVLLLLTSISIRSIADEKTELKVLEDSLGQYFHLLATEDDDQKKLEINDHILHLFRKALKFEESFYYPFYNLKNVGVIKSDDYNLRIITWNLPYNDRTHKYFGFIQYKKNNRSYDFFELKDHSEQIKNPEMAVLTPDNWYGALYYKIISNKSKGTEYFTLLGSDLNNLLTKKKIIDILYFNEDDQPVFGNQVFKNKVPPVSRVIFEFNGQANMTLAYDEERDMIVFDHLSPSRPSLKGQYEFYGPDFSYDGLKFERGIWNLYSDIDARNFSIGEF